ncbi:hypothetical protein GGR09_000540 [Bartonella heixiaziensis]
MVRYLFRSNLQPEQSYSKCQLYTAALNRMAREIAVINRFSKTRNRRKRELFLPPHTVHSTQSTEKLLPIICQDNKKAPRKHSAQPENFVPQYPLLGRLTCLPHLKGRKLHPSANL